MPSPSKKAQKNVAKPTSRALAVKPPDTEKELRDKEDLAFTRRSRSYGVVLLDRAALKLCETEARGDCWLLSLLANHGLPLTYLKSPDRISRDARVKYITPWRHKLVEFLTNVEGNEDGKELRYGKRIDKELFESFCGMMNVKVTPRDAQYGYRIARHEVYQRLQPWLQPFHYGKDQQAVHAGMGWLLKKNVLEIGLDDEVCKGERTLVASNPRNTLIHVCSRPCT